MSGPLVIVGGGSTGCLIASRASESGRLGVLLLEAGRDYGPSAALPGDLQDGGRNSMVRHDWGYRHHPTTQQIRFPFPRGRVLGGSSAVNTCIALRGQPEDFDEWAALGLLGASGAPLLADSHGKLGKLDLGNRALFIDGDAVHESFAMASASSGGCNRPRLRAMRLSGRVFSRLRDAIPVPILSDRF